MNFSAFRQITREIVLTTIVASEYLQLYFARNSGIRNSERGRIRQDILRIKTGKFQQQRIKNI